MHRSDTYSRYDIIFCFSVIYQIVRRAKNEYDILAFFQVHLAPMVKVSRMWCFTHTYIMLFMKFYLKIDPKILWNGSL